MLWFSGCFTHIHQGYLTDIGSSIRFSSDSDAVLKNMGVNACLNPFYSHILTLQHVTVFVNVARKVSTKAFFTILECGRQLIIITEFGNSE